MRFMAKIKITQIKSGIDRSERQKLTLAALGLKKVNASKEVEATPQILGMVEKVHHLVNSVIPYFSANVSTWPRLKTLNSTRLLFLNPRFGNLRWIGIWPPS